MFQNFQFVDGCWYVMTVVYFFFASSYLRARDAFVDFSLSSVLSCCQRESNLRKLHTAETYCLLIIFRAEEARTFRLWFCVYVYNFFALLVGKIFSE